jgi:hypothetical protein
MPDSPPRLDFVFQKYGTKLAAGIRRISQRQSATIRLSSIPNCGKISLTFEAKFGQIASTQRQGKTMFISKKLALGVV